LKSIFSVLREQALAKSRDLKDEEFLIRGLWKTDLIFKPNVNERTFKYTYVLAQTIGQGCCYCTPDVTIDPGLLGQDAREVIREKNPVSIAVLDSIYSGLPHNPQQVHKLCCDSVEKTALRNSIIVQEAERLLAGINNKRAKVVNVGLVGDLVRRLCADDRYICATDFDEAVIGKSLHGVTVESGLKTVERVGECDLAIVTGMTIFNDSLEEIVEVAQSRGTKLLMFCETGANFAEEYCRSIGIDTAVSEPFPFYIFQGTTHIEVYRKTQGKSEIQIPNKARNPKSE
jgi:hypothetical protein